MTRQLIQTTYGQSVIHYELKHAKIMLVHLITLLYKLSIGSNYDLTYNMYLCMKDSLRHTLIQKWINIIP